MSGDSIAPDRPDFVWEQLPSDNGYAIIRINWLPNLNGRPGTHFFAKYRIKGDTTWLSTDSVLEDDFVVIRGLQPDDVYEFVVISIDGEHLTESQIQEVPTVGIGKKIFLICNFHYCHQKPLYSAIFIFLDGPNKIPSEDVAAAGWLIGMLLAIALLLLLLIIVCVVKRNRGGKYDVYDRELANGRRDYPEEGGFHEYSQP